MAMLWFACAAGAQELQLHAGAGDAKGAKAIAVPSEGRIPLALSAKLTKDDAGKVIPLPIVLEVTPFTGDYGHVLTVALAQPDGKLGPRRTVTLDQPILHFELVVGRIETDEKFTGSVVVLSDDVRLLGQPYTLSRAAVPRPATLTVDEPAITVTHTRSILPGILEVEEAQFVVHLHDKANAWPVEGVFARLIESKSSKSIFDPKRDLSFEFDGRPVADLWGWPPPTDAPRDIKEGAIAKLRCQVESLEAGEHKVTLRFDAHNTKADDAQKLVVTIQVKDSIWWAIGILLLAIGVSYVVTRWLVDRRRALGLRQEIGKLRKPWLRREPATLPVAWVRAMLRQAADRCQGGLFLVGADTIQLRIQQVQAMLPLLDAIRKIRGRIRGLRQDDMVKRRAKKLLRQIIDDLGEGPIDENVKKDVAAALNELNRWFKVDDTLPLYEKDLERDVASLLASVRPDKMGAGDAARAEVERLYKELKAPSSPQEPVDRERTYAKLKVLWERRDRTKFDEFDELVRLSAANEPVERIFDEADRAAWERLEKAQEKPNTRIRLTSPHRAALQPFEAYQPLQFKVEPADASVGNNYLYKHGLEYSWSIEVRRRGASLRFWVPRKLRPVTQEPRVVQYGPAPCTLKPRVEIRYKTNVLKCSFDEEIEIGPAADARVLRSLVSVEAISLFFAVVFALLAGLGTMYIGKPTFGGLGTYITLFLWGAGVDQSKNFIQQLSGIRGGGGDE